MTLSELRAIIGWVKNNGRNRISDEEKAWAKAEIDRAVSPVSAQVSVREALVAQQQRIGRAGDYVVEGRDIGTTVIPDAEVKIFMTASLEVRAKRRYNQMIELGKEADYDQILKETAERDYQDSHREVSPLRQAEDAVLLDTSNMTLEENIDAVAHLITEKTGVMPAQTM